MTAGGNKQLAVAVAAVTAGGGSLGWELVAALLPGGWLHPAGWPQLVTGSSYSGGVAVARPARQSHIGWQPCPSSRSSSA